MEEYSKKLTEIFNNLQTLYIEQKVSNIPMTLEKKLELFHKNSVLINEANDLITKMDALVADVTVNNFNPQLLNNIDTYTELLEENLNINELMYILSNLQTMSLKTSTCVVEDINNDVFYEQLQKN